MTSIGLLTISTLLSAGIAVLAYQKAITTKKTTWKIVAICFGIITSLKLLALLLT